MPNDLFHPPETLAADDVLTTLPYPEPIDDEAANRIARLALHMTLHATRGKMVVSPMGLRTWEQRTPEERARMRAGVIRTVQALQMLEYISR